MKIIVEVDVEKQKVLGVDSGDLNPILTASILTGVASGLLSSVKIEVKPKNKIITPKSDIIKPNIKV